MIKLDPTAKYLLAVSGGVDSMTMLHMFASLSPRPDFSVATVNHNIRKEAQADCDFVENYCRQLDVECHKVFVDVPKYADEHRLSEETAARILRYQVLNNFVCDYICLAHNMGDNAETVLMHILRGSGAQGASGIRRQNGRYLRPILDMTREQIERYAAEHNVPYVHDVTNDEIVYTRNFIRKKVLPMLAQLNPNAEQNIARFAENIFEDCEYLDSLADMSDIEFGADYARIPVKLLLQPKPLTYRTVAEVFRRLGVYKDIERRHIEAITDIAKGVGGRRVNLPFGFVAVSDYDYITIEREKETHSEDFEIPFKVGKTVTPSGVVEVTDVYSDGALKIDVSKLPEDAVFRLRRQGDMFTKFGGGTKTLKKYLIDKKVPQRLRDDLILIACGSEVYAICGVEISDKVKTDVNSEIYYITIRRGECNEIQ